MASSVLQLHDTPWLPRQWDTRNILILKDHSGDFLPSAYVGKTFSSSVSNPADKQQNPYVKNEQVFALGVALIELAHGTPILSHRCPEDLDENGNTHIYTEPRIAHRLAERIESVEYENYAKAVVRCIRCSFDTFKLDFEDDDFREKFYEGVVVPLEKDWKYANGISQ
jgi:hypothetical protein